MIWRYLYFSRKTFPFIDGIVLLDIIENVGKSILRLDIKVSTICQLMTPKLTVRQFVTDGLLRSV